MDTYSVMSIVSDPVKNMAMQITLLELTSFPLDMCQVVELVVHTIDGFFFNLWRKHHAVFDNERVILHLHQ